MADEQTVTQEAGAVQTGGATAPDSGVTHSADGESELSTEQQETLDNAAKGIPPPMPGEEVKPEVTAEAKPEVTTEVKSPPMLTAEQIHTAQRAGLSPELVEAMGDKAATVLDGLKAQLFDRESAARGAQQATTQVGPGEFDLSQPFALAMTPVTEGETVTGYKIGNTEYEPEYVESIIKPQVQFVEGLRQSVARMQAQTMFQETEAFFQKIAPEYGEMFGKERMAKLDWRGPTGKARIAVIEKAKQLLDAAHNAGNFFVGIEDCLSDAQQIVGKDFHKQAALNAVRNRQGQFTQRPSQRQTPEKFQSPREKAVAVADAKWSEIKASGGLDD